VVLICLQQVVSLDSWSLCQFGHKVRRIVPRSPREYPHRIYSCHLVQGAVAFRIAGMPPAIRSIVDVHVRYRNRRALDELRARWGRLLAGLRTIKGPFDVSKPIAELEDEIAVIEAGLAKLNGAAAA
jgi:hypothetical protein